ncbi:Hsp20/alpha crystallin family protein [Terriglobus saanensis]|uniref:Heat shock protein Hsp20 n=1 Tax=Terriglobus saanensis (strain ATCC BAA-1853 / DSM 23119 / SP1PR4) TaxID=401053 RepID=E8V302_TERSS|nr:Hsp20/alpha crystallin family protein [Terriglobus saanensis]ADV84699.1 heat shock protein Hsp20 [Terriglobus saanensis SP1PR4]
MTITRFSPLHDVAVLQNRLNSIFSDFARPTTGETESLNSGSFTPPVDIYEDPQKLALRIEVPGIRPEDVDIRVENTTLTVRGERKFATEDKEENFHRVERRYGSFVRSFTLPQTLDTEQIKANYEHGVLTLELPKKPEAKPKQIKIEIGTGASPKQVEAAK